MMSKSEPKQICRLNRLAAGLLVGLWAATPGWVNALPSGGEIVSGKGSISIGQPSAQDIGAPQHMVIQQDSQRLITNWQGFSIGSAESVTFKQPNSSSVALNRVIGVDPSIILGKLSSNGQVFLSNPSGVIFGQGAVVDVHGLLATTLNITDRDFLNDNYQFTQDPRRFPSAVINDGSINATRYVGFAAPAVANFGSIIVADLGSVALATGTEATLDFNGDGLISFVVTRGEAGLIHNSGLIRANGGQVLLTAKSAGNVIGNVINHTGIIEAQTVQQKDGKIILSSGNRGNVRVSGTLDASESLVTADVVTVARRGLVTNNGDISIVAKDLDLRGDLNSGKGDVSFTAADGRDLNFKSGNNPGGGVGGNDVEHIIAENLIIRTDGNINVKGITEKRTAGIADSVILESGGDITFEEAVSVFPGLKLMAVNDINVNVGITTTRGDFVAVADSENNGQGEFNVASGVVITSARDIDVSAVNINADNEESFDETRDLILNGSRVGESTNNSSVGQASLSSFLTEFFENAGSGGC